MYNQNYSTGKVFVGPLLYSLYEGIQKDDQKVAFKKFVSTASPKHEILATFPSIDLDVAQAIMTTLQKVPMGQRSVIGAQGFGDGFIFYITGDFPEDVFTMLIGLFSKMATQVNVKAEIFSGSPQPDKLKELL